MVEYTVTFERIGRRGGANGSAPPAPLTAKARDGEDLLDQILRYSRPFLGSLDVGVTSDSELTRGFIDAGGRNAGNFTIERTSP